MARSEAIHILDTYPCLRDNTPTTPHDSHYFYQDIWAFRRIVQSKVSVHVDVGSRLDFVGMLSTCVRTVFVDIRPAIVTLPEFHSVEGTILNLPFGDSSVKSMSCLHVAEHIGLGRYGDPLDPQGTEKAAKELARALARNGRLYFSLPVGKPRVCFNAHRIHSPRQVLNYFEMLKLVEISGIDDSGAFIENVSIEKLENCDYGCGLFCFTKN